MEILQGFIVVLSSPQLLGWIILAALLGTIVGAIPGLTASAAIAILLPITFYMDPLAALAFLYVMGKSGRYGGSIAAILFNTPGTIASAATQIDGYSLSQKGMSAKAMKVATISSVIGDYTGEILLILGIGVIASIALKLGPPELFAIYFAAFVVIGSVIGKSILKGLASASLGVLIQLIGIDPITATERFTFGNFNLMGGIALVPLMIGMFVLSEVFIQIEKSDGVEDSPEGNLALKTSRPKSAKVNSRLTWHEYKPCLPHAVRSSFIGAFIGVLPGLGSAVAAFTAYGEGKRRAKNPEQWGQGALEGIAAPEAANNAVSGPSMAPLLTLGIPGSTIGAILIGVFLIHGIQIGPTILLTSRELIYSLFAAGLIGIAAYGIIGYFGANFIGQFITKVPTNILYPMIFLISFIATYATRGSLFDVGVMIVVGLIGWVMKKLDFSVAAFIIAFVLTSGAEETFRQSLLLSDQGGWIFITRPIALGFILLALMVLVLRSVNFNRTLKL